MFVIIKDCIYLYLWIDDDSSTDLFHIHEEDFGPFFEIKPTYGLHQNKVHFDQTTTLGMSNEANLDMFDTWNELY